jgi:hypothetical protein
MKIQILLGMIFSAVMLTLSGCGGGGGDTTAVIPPGTPTIVSGTPFKGPFDSVGSSVKIFGVDATGAKLATPLKTVQIDALGGYGPVDISPYTGTIVVEVTGTYKDEATGVKVAMDPAGPPLRAVISDAKGNVTVNVTPLTELAVQKVGAVLTKTIIDKMNTDIGTLFKVDDIIKTKPVDATTAAAATATAAEKSQSLVLAAISQLVKNSGNTLGKVLGDMGLDITVGATDSKLGDTSAAGFKTAMFDFVTDTTKNLTGVTTIAGAPVVGTLKLAHLQISTTGLIAPALIGGIDFTFNLPFGVTLSSDPATFQVSPGVVVVSGVAAVTGTTSVSLSTLHLPALRTVVANAQGFGTGEFVNISCTIPAGNPAAVADFNTAITSATTPPVITDLKGAPIAGVTLTATTVIF